MSRDQAADKSEHEPQPGDVIADRYRIERKLGKGGMGVVLAAQHVALKQRVAIKLMLPHALRDTTAVSRFMREAWAASQIKSEYVTRVFDLGALPNGAPYLVMEHLEGYDLGARVKREGKLPLEDVLDIALQACEALAEAHALGIVHRDLKPSNIFCVRRSDGRTAIKVLDFGISKLTQDNAAADDLSLTRTMMVMGSPYYMSPEQMASAKSVDPRADVWSLGIILYELLSGRVPFRGESLPELAVAIATQTPRPLSAARPDVPKKLAAVVARCLEKKRDDRYASVAELARALSAFAAPPLAAHAERAERVLRNANGTMSTWGEEQPDVVATPAQSDWREREQPRRRGLAAAGITVALAVAGVSFWFWQSRAQLESTEPHIVVPAIVVPANTLAVDEQAEKARVNGPEVAADIPTVVQPAAAAAAARSPASPTTGVENVVKSSTGTSVHAATSQPPASGPAAPAPLSDKAAAVPSDPAAQSTSTAPQRSVTPNPAATTPDPTAQTASPVTQQSGTPGAAATAPLDTAARTASPAAQRSATASPAAAAPLDTAARTASPAARSSQAAAASSTTAAATAKPVSQQKTAAETTVAAPSATNARPTKPAPQPSAADERAAAQSPTAASKPQSTPANTPAPVKRDSDELGGRL